MIKKTNFSDLFAGEAEKTPKLPQVAKKAVTTVGNIFDQDEKKHPHQLTAVYIACYMGKSGSEIRSARWNIFVHQLIEYKALDIYLVNMEFTKAEFALLDSFGYKIHYLNPANDTMKLTEARNVSLKHFYNSDHDYCFLADNDAWIDPDEVDGRSAIDSWNNCKSEDAYLLDKIDMWAPASRMMVTASNANKHLYPNLLVFQRKFGNKGSLRALRNLKKHKGIELYLPNMGNCEQGEDYLFDYMMLQHGLECWNYMNSQLKEVCPKGASFYAVGGNAGNRDFENGLRNVIATLKEPKLTLKATPKKGDPTQHNYSLNDKAMKKTYLTSSKSYLEIAK